jgi:hypothetical protein
VQDVHPGEADPSVTRRPLLRITITTLAAAVAAAGVCGPARAGEGMFVGVSDDSLKWEPAEAVRVMADLGVPAVRVTLPWRPGASRLDAEQAAVFDRLVPAAFGMRVVVAVYGHARDAPSIAPAREAYCDYVADFLTRYPTVNDVVIWNEPNLGFFWLPQFHGQASAAPADYAALLARCWDVLHGMRPDVNLISNTSPRGNDRPRARSNVSHSPRNFIRQLGHAYRASGRTRPLFDTVGHHVYGLSSAEPPGKAHPGSTQVGQGDLPKLLAYLEQAFGGTGQPLPGNCPEAGRCVRVWYLEAGYQTRPDPEKRSLYVGRETDARAVPAVRPASAPAGTVDQAGQLRAGIRLAYCQPHVEAYFNFLLRDDTNLLLWQSGLLWADGTPKPSYGAFAATVSEVRERRVSCPPRTAP